MLGREGKAGSSGRAGETGVRNNKNNTIEASMLLKTNEGVCKTKLKRTPSEPQLSAEIRASRVEFEFSSSRLDKLGTSIVADLNSGRVAASYRRMVAFWHTTLIPHPFWSKLE
jgi:hypothetical protein